VWLKLNFGYEEESMRCPLIGILALAILLSGCATMFASHSDMITIKTEPPGAEVYRGADLLGATPLTYTFNRNTFEQKKLNIRMKGFKTKELELGHTLEPVALFNFGFFLTTSGATSWGIDVLTGAMIKYDPNSYFIDLEPADGKLDSKEISRRWRALFVLINQDALRDDIARGDGEYLSAYYGALSRAQPYDTFIQSIRKDAAELLAQEDGVELYRFIEAESH
jgi:hypothetical protein